MIIKKTSMPSPFPTSNIVGEKKVSDTDVYNCNYVNKVTTKNIISVSQNNSQQIGRDFAIVKLDKILIKVGDKLNLVNNQIKIEAGVSKILISGSIFADPVTTGYIYLFVRKNGINISQYITDEIQQYKSVQISTFGISVSANDVIDLYCQYNTAGNPANTRQTGTYLTIEVIE